MEVFQTTWLTWPFIDRRVSNYMIYLTIYLWMSFKLLALLDNLSMLCLKSYDVFDHLSMDMF